MKDFILTPGYSINPAQISFIRFEKDGGIQIHLGANALTFEGQQAADLRELLAPGTTGPAAVPARGRKGLDPPLTLDPAKPVE